MRSQGKQRHWIAPVLLAAALVACGSAVSGQDAVPTLTVQVVVCPSGTARPALAVCEARMTPAFTLSVADAAYTPIATDVRPQADGRAIATLGEETGLFHVIINTAVNVGTRTISCQAGSAPIAAAPGGGAAIPVFQIDTPPGVDVSCLVYLYGFPGDEEALDIVTGSPPLDAAVATPRPRSLTRTALGGVPQTGVGAPRSRAPLSALLAVMAALAAGTSWVFRGATRPRRDELA